MPSPSSISFSLSLLTAGYLAFCSLTPRTSPPTPNPMRRPCNYGHHGANDMTTTSDRAYLEAICPHPSNLPPHLFAWSATTTLCLLSLTLGASLRLSAFKFLGRNFTFQLAQPDTLVTGGIYRFVQHPSYTGLWLLATGYLGLIMRWDGAVACTIDSISLARLSGWGGWVVGVLVTVLIHSTVMRVRDEEGISLLYLPTYLYLSPLPSTPTQIITMGLLGRAAKITTIGAGATVGFFFAAVRHNEFVPMTTTDPLFQHPLYQKLNPSNNPASYDLCVRQVPLKDIKPALLEKPGRLTEAFCAGVWSGFGYAYQRRYLSKKYEGPETSSHLWTRADLRAATYDVGTKITDHFEVVEKTPERIVVRCGDSPRNADVRESDGLFEMSTEVKPEKGVAEFRLKSLFFQGKGKAEGEPMPSHVLWLHKQYTKLWLETALGNIWR
ncbi:hypothetical protein BO94DRAFT_565405 [Aspergillus sclerotioniger CBS 115572]|uniref:Protein-S-isoprenylcysteine O-methyltransferase n=1 Tax=Aspergillus sclerotioniger CBS 115572 TaxID=1450535 RepID=A0A317WUZ8_9EURO|nr:hypothetical protein BO94DRAFT_565405 [Aspergillus sclerotioniger CBS 115572]PWY89641.1 hypothetical protein BO94DRAFT_565405 [Aspergillus sclerotioniger CBS 115572]